MNKVFVICGPTSSGKTSLALNLCKKYGGEIISADSRQVYRLMDIGTGKIPLKTKVLIEQNSERWAIDGINIWGYDLANPDYNYSAYEYAGFARTKINELIAERKNVFLVGGTGFYVDATTGRMVLSGAEPDYELRAYLQALPLEELQDKLKQQDPQKFSTIDLKNKVRLIRALEIQSESQKVQKKLKELPKLENVGFVYLGLTASREVLYKKVDNWAEGVWNNGLEQEVENLLAKGYVNSPKLNGLVYKSVLAYINKEQSRQQAVQRTKFDLHAYIRRQQTWFKPNQDINWFDFTQDAYTETVYNFVDRELFK